MDDEATIETAPMDGTVILLKNGQDWFAGFAAEDPDYPWQFLDRDGRKTFINGFHHSYGPTHWAPLVRAPVAEPGPDADVPSTRSYAPPCKHCSRGWREFADMCGGDAEAVRRFANLMTVKMAASRAKGRSGWQTCSVDDLWRMLRDHVEKGDPVDVANFAMMIRHNSEATT